jgi:general secretion pathway protein C
MPNRRISGPRFLRALRAHFWAPVCVLVSLCAYWQARGVGALLRASLLPESETLTARARPLARFPSPEPPPSDSSGAGAILARNPFDSTMVPLAASTVVPTPPPRITNPLQAPECEKVQVRSVAEAEDPHWSSAVIESGESRRGKLYRADDRVGGKRVAYIGYNPLERSPAVWLVEEGKLCQSFLFGDLPPEPPKRKAKPARKRSKRRGAERRKTKKRRTRRAPPLPNSLRHRIELVGVAPRLCRTR